LVCYATAAATAMFLSLSTLILVLYSMRDSQTFNNMPNDLFYRLCMINPPIYSGNGVWLYSRIRYHAWRL